MQRLRQAIADRLDRYLGEDDAARMVRGLCELGWQVEVHNLVGAFPDADADARRSLTSTLAGIPAGARVVIDGLAMGGLPEPVWAEHARLRILALVHHPLADETGLDEGRRARFVTLERNALAGCAGVLVTSEFTACRLEAFGVEPTCVRAVRPGTDRARPARGRPRRRPGRVCAPAVLIWSQTMP